MDVVSNEAYVWSTHHIDYKDFVTFYQNKIEFNNKLGLMYARLSVSPTSYLTDVAIHTFEQTDWNV